MAFFKFCHFVRQITLHHFENLLVLIGLSIRIRSVTFTLISVNSYTKQWEVWAIHILDTPESSLTLAYKQNIAKNSLKIEFWRISSKLKKCQNAHPTGSQITFYGHPWFWKPPLVSQDKSRSNGKLGPSIFWTPESSLTFAYNQNIAKKIGIHKSEIGK